MRKFLPLIFLAGCTPSRGVPPSITEEHLVAKYIIDRAGDPDSISFVKWGPHKGSNPKCVRVIYRGKNNMGTLELGDIIVVVNNGKVTESLKNPFGDDYVEGWRKVMAPPKMTSLHIPQIDAEDDNE